MSLIILEFLINLIKYCHCDDSLEVSPRRDTNWIARSHHTGRVHLRPFMQHQTRPTVETTLKAVLLQVINWYSIDCMEIWKQVLMDKQYDHKLDSGHLPQGPLCFLEKTRRIWSIQKASPKSVLKWCQLPWMRGLHGSCAIVVHISCSAPGPNEPKNYIKKFRAFSSNTFHNVSHHDVTVIYTYIYICVCFAIIYDLYVYL